MNTLSQPLCRHWHSPALAAGRGVLRRLMALTGPTLAIQAGRTPGTTDALALSDPPAVLPEQPAQ
jgi:hypothetical protein